MKINLGYCCINMTLQKERKVTIGRGMIKKTFAERGINYASELALANVKDMVEIIKWNHKNGISLYRMSSDMFPWCSEYDLKDLPDYDKICNILKGAGTLANQYGQRLTFHPGPFSVLASANPDVVTKTIRDLNTYKSIDSLSVKRGLESKLIFGRTRSVWIEFFTLAIVCIECTSGTFHLSDTTQPT